MDAIELLISDHRTVDGLFQQFERGGNSEEFTQLFAQLKDELTVHTQIEEEIFYPAARENPDTADLVAEAYQEQAEVKQLLARVEGLDNTSTEWGQQMTEIMRDVQAHVQMEETEMFPRVRESFDAATLADLGQRLTQRKAELKGQTGTTDAATYQAPASNIAVTDDRNYIQPDNNPSGQLGALDATIETDRNQPSL